MWTIALPTSLLSISQFSLPPLWRWESSPCYFVEFRMCFTAFFLLQIAVSMKTFLLLVVVTGYQYFVSAFVFPNTPFSLSTYLKYTRRTDEAKCRVIISRFIDWKANSCLAQAWKFSISSSGVQFMKNVLMVRCNMPLSAHRKTSYSFSPTKWCSCLCKYDENVFYWVPSMILLSCRLLKYIRRLCFISWAARTWLVKGNSLMTWKKKTNTTQDMWKVARGRKSRVLQ